jgi:putative exporter of polyketide antibiotics
MAQPCCCPVIFAVTVVVALFGTLLHLPGVVIHASPFAVAPTVPVKDWVGVMVLLAVDLLLPALAVLAVRRRDVVA